MLTYFNFDLRIKGTAGNYSVAAEFLKSSASAAFPTLLPKEDLSRFLVNFRQLELGISEIEQFGSMLFHSVFAGDVLSLLRESQRHASRIKTGALRVRLQIEPPELAELPWEYLYDPEYHQFLAVSIETPILRYLPLPERKPLKTPPPLRILVTVSSPKEFPELKLEKEWANVQQAIADRPRVEVVRLERPTLKALLSALRRNDFHILHFIGHGFMDARTREGALVFEKEDGAPHPLPGRSFGTALHDERTLRLVVVNACHGATFLGSDPFAGVAQSIIRAGIPAVIAMQSVITDDSATIFARELYSALADGYPVDAALSEARKMIFSSGNLVEWGAPVLFLRSQDGQILDIEMKEEQPSKAPAPAPVLPIEVPAAEPERGALRSPSEPRLWLATDAPPRMDWEDAFRKHRLVWSSRGGAAVQKYLREITSTDQILAYRTLGNYLLGLATVSGELGRSGRGETMIPIGNEVRFERGISLDDIRHALPNSQLISRGRLSTLAPIPPEDWAVLRALILHHNPILAADVLPPSTVSPQVRGGIEKVHLRNLREGDLGTGDKVDVSVQIRNRGNVVWAKGEAWSLVCRWWPKNRPGGTPARQWDWGFTLDDTVPPGGSVAFSDYFDLPLAPGLYRAEWKFTGRGESEPATKIETVVVNRFRPLVDIIREHLQRSKPSARELAARLIERETLDLVTSYEVEDEKMLLEIAGQFGISGSVLDLVSAEPQPTPPEPAPVVETGAAALSPKVDRNLSGSPPLLEPRLVTPPPSPASQPTEVQVLPIPGVSSPSSLLREATPAGPTMIIEIDTDEVTLRFGDRIYRSRLRLDAERLVAAASPREYGEALFDALFNPNGLDGFDSSTLAGYNWASAQPGGGRRIEIELRTLELQDRKWEYLADSRDRGELPLAAVQIQPFYRRWGNAKNALAVARPLRILAAIASPATLGRELDDKGKKVSSLVAALSPIDVAQERDILETGLQRLAGFAEYHVLDVPVTLKALREALQDGYHVLHLLAHGLLVEGSHYLVLEGDEPPHHLVTAEAFCNTLQGSSLRLVVLAACQSAVPDAARSLRGLGVSLLDAVPAVIAMQDEIRIDTAQLFTQHFYDRLARTGRVDQAMARTRAALYQEGDGKQWQWGVPVLLMSTGNGRLFDVDEARVAQELPRLKPQVKSYQELAGAGDPTIAKWEQAFRAAARAHDLPVTVLPAPAPVPFAAPATPSVEPETLARPQDRAELLALARIDLNIDELRQEVAGECLLDLPSGVYSQIAAALNAGKHVILIGPPGTGKTSLAHAVCNFARKKGFATGAALTTATADWTAFDTVGGYVPTLQQTLQFRAGVFLEAIRTGRWLVIDEINRADIDKAFGELFTVLAGQQVDLPYSVGSYRVRVLPPAGSDPETWLPAGLLSGYDYVIHPNWRIVATMNVYDKSHLFTLSFAFMRRFAFIDVDLPGKDTYDALIDTWLVESRMPPEGEHVKKVREILGDLLSPDNALTSCRELGPAIVKDMIAYMSNRYDPNLPPLDLLAEALLLYVTPQLDGIDSERIVKVRSFLAKLVDGSKAGESLLRRVRSLYPHVPPEAWT